jgi:hypothetical protein
MFAVGLRQYPKSAAVLRILQPQGGLCPVTGDKADVIRHRLGHAWALSLSRSLRQSDYARHQLTNGCAAAASNFRE